MPALAVPALIIFSISRAGWSELALTFALVRGDARAAGVRGADSA